MIDLDHTFVRPFPDPNNAGPFVARLAKGMRKQLANSGRAVSVFHRLQISRDHLKAPSNWKEAALHYHERQGAKHPPFVT